MTWNKVWEELMKNCMGIERDGTNGGHCDSDIDLIFGGVFSLDGGFGGPTATQDNLGWGFKSDLPVCFLCREGADIGHGNAFSGESSGGMKGMLGREGWEVG